MANPVNASMSTAAASSIKLSGTAGGTGITGKINKATKKAKAARAHIGVPRFKGGKSAKKAPTRASTGINAGDRLSQSMNPSIGQRPAFRLSHHKSVHVGVQPRGELDDGPKHPRAEQDAGR